MFKVIAKNGNNIVRTVYAVQTVYRNRTDFLLWDDGIKSWMWVDSGLYEPIEGVTLHLEKGEKKCSSDDNLIGGKVRMIKEFENVDNIVKKDNSTYLISDIIDNCMICNKPTNQIEIYSEGRICSKECQEKFDVLVSFFSCDLKGETHVKN